MDKLEIPTAFLQKASGLLDCLSGSKIVDAFLGYGERWNVDVPYFEYPFVGLTSKRQVIYENLRAFPPTQQFHVIDELASHSSIRPSADRAKALKQLKLELHSKYNGLSSTEAVKELDLPLIEETRHWLKDYPDALKLFDNALWKYQHRGLERNLLDDLRLALEKLLKKVLQNNRPLEKQANDTGLYLKQHGGSPQLRLMFTGLLGYYANYQNDYIKHDDRVKETEVEFVFEITASFMKHIVRVASTQKT